MSPAEVRTRHQTRPFPCGHPLGANVEVIRRRYKGVPTETRQCRECHRLGADRVGRFVRALLEAA